MHAGTATYNTQIAELQKRGPMDIDLAAVVPALNTLRGIRGGYDQRDAYAPIELYVRPLPGRQAQHRANDAYVRALNGLLLPRMLARIETQMLPQRHNPDFLYQALKVYLILGRTRPARPRTGDAVVLRRSARHVPERGRDGRMREALTAHADAMLQQPLTQLALNDPLIAQARAVLNKEPLAEYSYNRIMRSKRVTEIPPVDGG